MLGWWVSSFSESWGSIHFLIQEILRPFDIQSISLLTQNQGRLIIFVLDKMQQRATRTFEKEKNSFSENKQEEFDFHSLAT